MMLSHDMSNVCMCVFKGNFIRFVVVGTSQLRTAVLLLLLLAIPIVLLLSVPSPPLGSSVGHRFCPPPVALVVVVVVVVVFVNA